MTLIMRRVEPRTVGVVVDASVVTAVVVADQRRDAARANLEVWLDVGEGLHAPAVVPEWQTFSPGWSSTPRWQSAR